MDERPGFFESYRRAFQLIGGATAGSVALLLFGFLSESALHQLAGLPQLSADYTTLLEAGARAVADTLAAIGPKVWLPLVALAAVRWAWVNRESRLEYRRLAQMPAALGTAQLASLVLATLVVWSLVSTSRVASGLRADQGSKVIADARTDPDWSPWVAQSELEATTYLRGPMAQLPRITGPRNLLCRKIADAFCPDGEEEYATPQGFPMKSSRAAREASRAVYGWLAVGVLLLGLFAGTVRVWRDWQSELIPISKEDWRVKDASFEDQNPAFGDGRKRARRWVGFYAASRLIVEPVLIAAAVLALALLPTAHGVLARDAIGMQQVMLRLHPASASRTMCSPHPATSWVGGNWYNSGENPPFDPAATFEQQVCDTAKLSEIQKEVQEFRNAWVAVMSLASSEEGFASAFEAYRAATDTLIQRALETHCAEAMHEVWLLMPTAGEFETSREVADYFVSRWSEAETLHSPLRFGYILNYPRGADSERVALFRVLHRARPGAGPRIAMQEISRECIAQMELLPDVRGSRLDAALRAIRGDPDSERISELATYPGPEALRAAF